MLIAEVLIILEFGSSIDITWRIFKEKITIGHTSCCGNFACSKFGVRHRCTL